MQQAVAYARCRSGPALVRASVTRPYSHSISDDERAYKSESEREDEATRDPLRRCADLLRAESLATDEELDALSADVDREIQDAADRAVAAPKPDRANAMRYVYSPTVDPASAEFETEPAPEGQPNTMISAINRTLRDEMTRDPHVVVFGEDVADASRSELLSEVMGKGGVFKATLGLQRAFGPERVFNSPLAEANIVGRAIGMALRGIKPVVEIQFFDYIWPAMMQIRDEPDDAALPVEQRVLVSGRDSRPDRGVSPWRRPIPFAIGREHLRPLPRCPHRVSVQTPPMPPVCSGPRFGQTIRCCFSSTSISIGKRITRRRIQAPTTRCPSPGVTSDAKVPTRRYLPGVPSSSARSSRPNSRKKMALTSW